MCTIPPTVLCQLFGYLIDVLIMVLRCAYVLAIILGLLLLLFSQIELSRFLGVYYSKYGNFRENLFL